MNTRNAKRSKGNAGLLLSAMLFALLTGPAWSGTDAGVVDGQKGEQASTADFQQLRQQWGEAMESLKGYSIKQRDKALAKGKATLDAMDKRLDQLESRVEEKWNDLSRETRKQRQEALRSLRKQRNQLAEWYGGIKHSSGDAWEEVKEGFVNSYDALSDSMGKAVDEFGSEDEQH